MHPILARRSRLALYLGVSVLVSGLLSVLLVAQARLGWFEALLVAVPLTVLYAFVCLSAWYVSRSMPVPTTATVRIVGTAAAAAGISSAGWVFAARLWIDYLLRRGWIAGTRPAQLDLSIFGFGMLLYVLAIAVSYLLAAFEQAAATEQRALRTQVLAREAELRALRTQIDPHFLFNSLHSISALTTADPPAARRMCLLLAEFMRETLALGAEERIPLARELNLADRFLAIERVRFGSRLETAVEADADARACLVPPLLLQPLVENAVAHGVAHVLEGGQVCVRAARTPDNLIITVSNPCDPDRPRRTGTGVGLSNVRARLDAAYGGAARLVAVEEDGRWRVELSLPAEGEQA